MVPKIGRGPGRETPQPSDVPTYAIVGVSVAAAIGAGAWAGFGAAIIAGIATLFVLGALYSIGARRWGWPPIRWEALPFFIP
ncbi:hypothetical protein FV220_23675 [Methylobacterium sp. WL19]|nr:hypothetical protein [Methylobacterium bullatum]TXN20775.1 hypothetical protein FV220_23675 [Methylobacterium sp. WL19]